MNKYVLPSVAAMLILVIAMSSFMPAVAVARRLVGPGLVVRTIPEDDQLRQTGVIVMGMAVGGGTGVVFTDWMAQYKLIITLDGSLVATSGILVFCNIGEKDKVSYPKSTTTVGKSVIPPRQTLRENLVTSIEDVSSKFLCKVRWKPGGLSVGVLDLYYIGPVDAAYIADHLVVVHVTYTVGRQTFLGTDLQDVCVLGWGMGNTAATTFTKTWGDTHQVMPDPLVGWAGCEDLALYQRSFFPGVTPIYKP